MEDLTILRRSILWNLEQKVFPSFTSSGPNTYEVKLALQAAYQEFVFVTAEIEDRDAVSLHAARLIEDLWEPAVKKLDTGYGGASEDREVTAILKEIAQDNLIEQSDAENSQVFSNRIPKR